MIKLHEVVSSSPISGLPNSLLENSDAKEG
jgi:hypothetical protein